MLAVFCLILVGCGWLHFFVVVAPCVGVPLVPGGDLSGGALRADVQQVRPVGGVDGVGRLVQDRPGAVSAVTAPHHQPGRRAGFG